MVEVVIVIANAEFFAFGLTVQLFAQDLIVVVIEVQAVYAIQAIRAGVRVVLHDREQAAAQGEVIAVGDFMFEFMPRLLIHGLLPPFRVDLRLYLV